MYGQLDNNYWFIINTTMESIQESVDIANRFLAYIGVAAALVGGILMWFASKRVTDPVLELAEISQRMAHLDFNARYQGKEKMKSVCWAAISTRCRNPWSGPYRS